MGVKLACGASRLGGSARRCPRRRGWMMPDAALRDQSAESDASWLGERPRRRWISWPACCQTGESIRAY